MYNKKLYFLILIGFAWASFSMNAQNTTLFLQGSELEGAAISGSSSSRSIHIADDFSLTTDATLSKVTLVGAQIAMTLSDILISTDFFLVEADELTSAPGTEHVVYESVDTMDNVTLVPLGGYEHNFEIDLSDEEIVLQANKKYWIIFTANIDAEYPSTMWDWHCYPGVNTEGTSLAKIYTNDAWSFADTGLTFSIEGETVLGITDIYNSNSTILSATVVTQLLEVRMDNFQTISVFDLGGKMILNSKDTITDVSSLSPGTYLGMVTTIDGQRITTKFVKN